MLLRLHFDKSAVMGLSRRLVISKMVNRKRVVFTFQNLSIENILNTKCVWWIQKCFHEWLKSKTENITSNQNHYCWFFSIMIKSIFDTFFWKIQTLEIISIIECEPGTIFHLIIWFKREYFSHHILIYFWERRKDSVRSGGNRNIQQITTKSKGKYTVDFFNEETTIIS